MQDFTKRRARGTVRRFVLGLGLLAVLGLFAFGAAHATWGMYGKFSEAVAANDDAQQNLAQLKAQDAGVQAEVASLATTEGQEAQLRQSYGVALPGEGEIQIIQESPTSTPQAPQENFFVKILKALFVW